MGSYGAFGRNGAPRGRGAPIIALRAVMQLATPVTDPRQLLDHSGQELLQLALSVCGVRYGVLRLAGEASIASSPGRSSPRRASGSPGIACRCSAGERQLDGAERRFVHGAGSSSRSTWGSAPPLDQPSPPHAFPHNVKPRRRSAAPSAAVAPRARAAVCPWNTRGEPWNITCSRGPFCARNRGQIRGPCDSACDSQLSEESESRRGFRACFGVRIT